MFSFNNPYGACAKCDGLGVIQFFNEKMLIQDGDVSIANGAIKGWTRRNRFYYYQLRCLSAHFDFTLTTKWKDYEDIQSDIFDHILASIHYFELEAYQEPSSKDLKLLISNL